MVTGRDIALFAGLILICLKSTYHAPSSSVADSVSGANHGRCRITLPMTRNYFRTFFANTTNSKEFRHRTSENIGKLNFEHSLCGCQKFFATITLTITFIEKGSLGIGLDEERYAAKFFHCRTRDGYIFLSSF